MNPIIDHIEIYVSNPAATAKWFEELLGFTFAETSTEPLLVQAGNCKLALYRSQGGAPKTAGVRQVQPAIRYHRLAFRVTAEEMGEVQARLATAGIAVKGPMRLGVDESIYFSDPDGNLLEVISTVE